MSYFFKYHIYEIYLPPKYQLMIPNLKISKNFASSMPRFIYKGNYKKCFKKNFLQL